MSVHTANLTTLISLKNQYLSVDRHGKLWSSPSPSNNKRIKEAVQSALNSLESITSEERSALLATLKVLPSTQFDRSGFSEKVEDILFPKLAKAKNELKSISKSEKGTYLPAKARYKIEQVRAALELGIEFKPLNSGKSGSYLGQNRMGKNLIVFKPSDEESLTGQGPNLLNSLAVKIKRIIGRIFPALSGPSTLVNPGEGYLAEVAASRLSNYLNHFSVPQTTIESFTSRQFVNAGTDGIEKRGSCQVFKKDAETLGKALKLPGLKTKPFHFIWFKANEKRLKDSFSVAEFQKNRILMWLTGDLDGHEENEMMNVKKRKLIKIDNGMSFYKEHPKHRWQAPYQHAWQRLPQANVRFTEANRAFIKSMDPEAIVKEVKEAMTLDGVCHFSLEQEVTLRDRIRVLKQYAYADKTLKELAQVVTADDFKQKL